MACMTISSVLGRASKNLRVSGSNHPPMHCYSPDCENIRRELGNRFGTLSSPVVMQCLIFFLSILGSDHKVTHQLRTVFLLNLELQ